MNFSFLSETRDAAQDIVPTRNEREAFVMPRLHNPKCARYRATGPAGALQGENGIAKVLGVDHAGRRVDVTTFVSSRRVRLDESVLDDRPTRR